MEARFSNETGLEIIVSDEHRPCDCAGVMGGDSTNPTWEEYLKNYKEEYRPHMELIKKAITEMGWIGETGGNKANDVCFRFSDGFGLTFSWRAWGDLMQAIVDKREGYMTYYM